MEFKNIIDLHTHTDNSFDGRHSTMYLAETAYMKGLRAVAFTDHIEMDAFFENSFDRTAIQSFFEIAKARSAFSGKLIVCIGAELGQAIYNKPVSEKLIDMMKYDFVIGSIHNLPGVQDFSRFDYSDENLNYMKMLEEYFGKVLELCQWDKFDSLGHLTYPVRYICGKYGKELDMTAFGEVIDEILVTLIKNNKALEINTSGCRQKLNKTMPDEDIVKRYRELGGKLITVGSDAHYAEHLGADIDKAYETALRCGFTEVAVYQDRTPTLIPIE